MSSEDGEHSRPVPRPFTYSVDTPPGDGDRPVKEEAGGTAIAGVCERKPDLRPAGQLRNSEREARGDFGKPARRGP